MYAFIAFYIAEEVWEVIHLQFKYVTMFWNYIDLVIIIVRLSNQLKQHYSTNIKFQLLIILVLANIVCAASLAGIDALINTAETYADFDHISNAHVYYNNVSGVLTFFAFIKLFKYLGFNRTMGQLNSTLKNVKRPKNDVAFFSTCCCIFSAL